MNTSSRLFATDHLEELIKRLMPNCLPLRLQELVVTAEEVRLVLACSQSSARCPLCGEPSTRKPSRYSRTLQDLPWGPLRVQLCLGVHRFFCQNPICPRKIFTEPLNGLAERSARRTTRLRDALLAIGWALGGQAGARQWVAHAMPVCGTTLLSLLRRWGPVVKPTPRVLGVDDWSFQARSAGTLLVDLERHQPVEVLLGSDEQVHELAAEGKTQADIIRHLHLHRHTVRKYLHMPTFVAHYCSPHPSLVEPYRAYLEARWQQGEVMIKTLWHALQEQGLTGSYKSVWTFVRTWPLPAGMTPTSSSYSVAPSTRRGAPTIRTPRPRKMAVVASARGSECKGCCLSAGIVGPFPTPFVSLITRSGRGFA